MPSLPREDSLPSINHSRAQARFGGRNLFRRGASSHPAKASSSPCRQNREDNDDREENHGDRRARGEAASHDRGHARLRRRCELRGLLEGVRRLCGRTVPTVLH